MKILDHFKDVRTLELHEPFVRYMKEAFRPLGVYLNFWQPTVGPASEREIAVMMVNDGYSPVAGRLELRIETEDGRAGSESIREFAVEPLGQQTYVLPVRFPVSAGSYRLKAAASPEGVPGEEATISIRKFQVAED